MIEIVPQFIPHWHLDLSDNDYHADKSALNSSLLKQMLKSPKSFLESYNSPAEEPTPAMRFGSAVHLAILKWDEFSKTYFVMPEFSGQGSMQRKSDWRLSLPKNAVILKDEEYESILRMKDSVENHTDARNLLKIATAERAGYFADPGTAIKCRIKPDLFYEPIMALADVKTTQDCSFSEFSKTIWNYRYDLQMAFYKEGIEQITGKQVEHCFFIVVEKKLPYECAVYKADETIIFKGMTDYRRTMDQLLICMKSNTWQFYQSTFRPIGLPPWALKEIQNGE